MNKFVAVGLFSLLPNAVTQSTAKRSVAKKITADHVAICTKDVVLVDFGTSSIHTISSVASCLQDTFQKPTVIASQGDKDTNPIVPVARGIQSDSDMQLFSPQAVATVSHPELSTKTKETMITPDMCQNIYQQRLHDVIQEVVVQTKVIDFDVETMRKEVMGMIRDFFVISPQDDGSLKLSFTQLNDIKISNIATHMNTMLAHIKSENPMLYAFFKRKIKKELLGYVELSSGKVYFELTKEYEGKPILYQGDSTQFKQDILTIVNSYPL